MNRAVSGAMTARVPYALVVAVNVCQCHVAPDNLGTARTVDRLVPWAMGYWSTYQAFWANRPRFISVSIVDTRDGSVMWRNGRHLLQEDESGNKVEYTGNHGSVRGHVRGNPRRSPSPSRIVGGFGS